MPSDVWFCPLEETNSSEAVARKTTALFDVAGLADCFTEGDKLAVKMHFGERDNTNVVHPDIIRSIVEKASQVGAKPFLTDSNTLYRGSRSNAVDHLQTACSHGYSQETMGCPVIIADGMTGSDRAVVPVDGKHYSEVSMASTGYFSDAAVVVTHVTGHCLVGYGGALKNVAMGFASRAGKLSQHHDSPPLFDAEKCIACGECARWCPADAIQVAETAILNKDKCIGCGECYTVCLAEAIGFNWSEVATKVQEKMAEHVLGYLTNKQGKMAYLNYVVFPTEDCDCGGTPQERAFRDIGIFAATDPVAIDAATLDVIKSTIGRDIFNESWPNVDHTIQLTVGEELGVGTRDYRLIEKAC